MSDLKDLYEFATIELWLLAGIAVILPTVAGPGRRSAGASCPSRPSSRCCSQ